MHIVFILSIAFVLVVSTATKVAAQGPCTPVYGGGVKADGSSYCMEDIMAMQPNTNPNAGDVIQNTTQTKGGLSVQQSPNVTHQPSTGPETTALLAIPFLAAAGWYLRKKTALSSAL
jgi:hypothetical protein